MKHHCSIPVVLIVCLSICHAAIGADNARSEKKFFNGKDLTGWSASETKYWSVKDGVIVGHWDKNVPRNEFLWSNIPVEDFYLQIDVKLEPNERNAGIQFRSKKANPTGQALGYQADVGRGVWGKLYHEHGRGKLDWNDRGPKAVKPGQWNRYEILAVGHRIWTAINGTLCVALEDPKGELTGHIALQIHSGPPQTVSYRIQKLVHHPKVELAGLNEKQLLAALPKNKPTQPKQPAKPKQSAQPRPAPDTPMAAWRKKLDANDPGLAGKTWAAPDHNDSKWKTMTLPQHWEGAGLPDFDGTVWYRKSIDVPAVMAGKKLQVELGPIDDMDMTWFNGQRIGGIEQGGHWTTPRRYSVPGKLVKQGTNVITVRVMDHGWGGGFGGKADQMKITSKGQKPIPLAGQWRYKTGVNLKRIGLGPVPTATRPATQRPAPVVPTLPALPALVRPLARPENPVAPFSNGFTVDRDQTLVILGSTNALNTSRHGYLETLISAAFPGRSLHVRNMAWQADSVYQQQRPRNFFAANKPSYGEKDGRPQTSAQIVFLWMGQSESLGGKVKLEDFKASYRQQISHIAAYTRRIVLVTPAPFDNPLKLQIDVAGRNQTLALYVNAIKQIGKKQNLPVVDLFSALRAHVGATALTHNGMHLTEHGHWLAAQAFARQLGFADSVSSIASDSPDHTLKPAPAEQLRQQIIEKNQLWFSHWRPTNWAFLYGNRQTQPSSRDHKDRRVRWFPQEINIILPLVDEADRRIHQTAQDVARQK